MVEREKREDIYRDSKKRDKGEEEEDKEHRHLPLLISRHFISSEFLDSAVKRCSSEVLKFSFQRSCSVKDLSRRN